MKLIDFYHHEDFGQEWDLNILKGKNRSFFQLFVSTPVYPYSPHISIELSVEYGLRFTLDLGKICVMKTFFGKHFV